MRRVAVFVLLLLATAAWTYAQTGAQAEKITNGPVVESVAGNQAKIAWSTNTGGSSIVRYGTDPNNLNQTAESPYERGGGTHRVTLNNLQPNTTYYYQVTSGQGSGTGSQAQSQIGQFNTGSGSGSGAAAMQGVSMQGGQQAGNISGAPMVESVTNNQAKIAWSVSGAGGNEIIRYGTSPSALNQTAQAVNAGGGTERATLSNLQPNTTYYYVVSSPQGQPIAQMGQFTTSNENSTRIPLYRSAAPNGSHLFTTSYPEQHNAVTNMGYKREGVTGYIEKNQGPGDVPLYRLRGPNGDHFYTANPQERQTAITNSHYADEGVVGYIASAPEAGTQPLYRVFNPHSGEHFYTTNAGERQQLLSSGWQDNGVVGYVWNQ